MTFLVKEKSLFLSGLSKISVYFELMGIAPELNNICSVITTAFAVLICLFVLICLPIVFAGYIWCLKKTVASLNAQILIFEGKHPE